MHDMLDSVVDIFGILENPDRRQMLRICSKQALTLEQISKIINHNTMATKKHLRILEKSKLVEKNTGAEFSITPIGDGCLQNMDSFEFLNKHKDFFLEHRFGDLNPNLLKRIGDLNNCKFYYGFHLVLPRWTHIVKQARKYLNLVFLHPPIVIADSIKPKVGTDLKIRLLIGKNSQITQCNEFVDRLMLNKPVHFSNFEKRRCGQVQMNLVMSEKEACVIFPNNNGITDMHGNFISKDPNLVNWCRDFFDYKWVDGEPISMLR